MRIRFSDLHKTDLTEVLASPRRKLLVTHPGAMLLTEFMAPRAISANALAHALRVPPNRVTSIVNGQRAITADTALRLARCFGTTPDFWLNLQKDYELRVAREGMDAELDAVKSLSA